MTFAPAEASRAVYGSSQVVNDAYNLARLGRNLSATRGLPYERYGGTEAPANPDFTTSTGGAISPAGAALNNASDPRILRGYIRRADPSASDPTSRYRLHFMFNPHGIVRDYVNYLDQLTLDPFNSLFDAGNLVIPPGILTFSFEMFFDREIEVARDAAHPGVQVDLDYFDRVVRGVEPSTSGETDNGLFLVNPRNLRVVFGPDLVVEGRVQDAEVNFTKFSHLMTPTRVVIGVTMNALYIGPNRNRPYESSVDDSAVERHRATVPYEEVDTTLSYEEQDATSWDSFMDSVGVPGISSFAGAPGSNGGGGAFGGSADLLSGATPWVGAGGGLAWPCANKTITSPFGPRWGRMHQGIDIGSITGDPIWASQSGTVEFAGWMGGYGNRVVVNHGHVPGVGNSVATTYSHLQSVSVAQGARVSRGQQVGVCNNTGSSQGHHLHFEVRVDGTYQNPLNFVRP